MYRNVSFNINALSVVESDELTWKPIWELNKNCDIEVFYACQISNIGLSES